MHQRCSELCSLFPTDDGYNTFHIIEAVYSDYLIFYLSNVKDEEEAQVMELYGRVFLCGYST